MTRANGLYGIFEHTSWGVEAFVRTRVFRKSDDIHIQMNPSTPHNSSLFLPFLGTVALRVSRRSQHPSVCIGTGKVSSTSGYLAKRER